MEGTTFGRYRLIELLGRGGMGEVWRAYDGDTKRVVAIKLLPTHLAHDETFAQRFRREAEAAAGLNNPHVIPIHHYGQIDGRLYVDMRLIEGRDLHGVLAEDGPLPPERAVHVIAQVAQALHAAHTGGLVHRDVKPSNILLDENDFAYLIDFGIARAAEDTGLTGTGATIGTWTYMAPERFTRTDIDARSDVYALACVLYQCLTGELPFPGESLPVQMHAHIYDDPPRPSQHRHHDIPAVFDAVIVTGMAKDPNHRYPTAIGLATAARAAITVPTPAPPANPPVVATRSAAPTRRPHGASAGDGRQAGTNSQIRKPPQTHAPIPAPVAAASTSQPWWSGRWAFIWATIGMAVIALATVGVASLYRTSPTEANEALAPAPGLSSPISISGDPPDAGLASAPVVAATLPSVLKIRGEAPSCQKVLEGSGFVVAANRVMTAAHVVAGATTVTVQTAEHTYDATVVSYDPNEDIAILEVPDLTAEPLQFDMQEASQGTDAIMLGYPGGGDFSATPARIRETIELNGPDIYHTMAVTRQAYTIRGGVHQGNAGGPLISLDGNVLGMVFGAAVDDADNGFVLTAKEAAGEMARINHIEPVATGTCIADH